MRNIISALYLLFSSVDIPVYVSEKMVKLPLVFCIEKDQELCSTIDTGIE